MKPDAWRKVHFAVGALVCVVVPAASYADGSGRLAYTMFAEVAEYRVEITADDRPIGATFLAARTGGTAGIFLAGAEHWKGGARHRTPRGQLDALAAFACTTPEAAGAHQVTVTLVERAEGHETRWQGDATCPKR